MKAEMKFTATPVARVVIKLAFLSGFLLAAIYGFLTLFATAIKIFQ
jgi:hypothetical protein